MSQVAQLTAQNDLMPMRYLEETRVNTKVRSEIAFSAANPSIERHRT